MTFNGYKIANTSNSEYCQDLFNRENILNKEFVYYIQTEIDKCLSLLDISANRKIFLANFLATNIYDEDSDIEVVILLDQSVLDHDMDLIDSFMSRISKNMIYKNRRIVFNITNNLEDLRMFFSLCDLETNKFISIGREEIPGFYIRPYFKNMLYSGLEDMNLETVQTEIKKYNRYDTSELEKDFKDYKDYSVSKLLLSDMNMTPDRVEEALKVQTVQKHLFEK